MLLNMYSFPKPIVGSSYKPCCTSFFEHQSREQRFMEELAEAAPMPSKRGILERGAIP